MTDASALNHQEIEGLLGAYALDAVDPDEARQVEAHLATCPRCRGELDAYRELTAALGNTVAPLPPHLWDRIAEQVSTVPTTSRPRSPSVLLPTEPAGPAQVLSLQQAIPPPGRPRRRLSGGWSVALIAGAAAVLALLAFLSISLVQANQQVRSSQQALTDHGGTAEIKAALATPGHQLVSLRSPNGSRLAEAVVVPGGNGYFVFSAMPALPHHETYQLWAIFQGRPVSLGLMGNDPGHVVFTVASGHPNQLAVTIEPIGGVSRPSHPPVATGSVKV